MKRFQSRCGAPSFCVLRGREATLVPLLGSRVSAREGRAICVADLCMSGRSFNVAVVFATAARPVVMSNRIRSGCESLWVYKLEDLKAMIERRVVVFVVALLVTAAAASSFASEYDVYLLAGQSNMDGYGYVKDLPEKLQKPQQGVMIFHGDSAADGELQGGRGIWTTLQPGHGVGFTSDGKTNHYSDRFGVELSFAARMRELRPDRKVAIIKYSRGGTSISIAARGGAGCWDSDFDLGEGEAKGINQYDHCLATIRNAFAQRDIDGDGEDDQLVPAGIVWMQGESDADKTVAIARAYEGNLSLLMDLLCAAMRVDDLPIAVGRISDSGRAPDGKVMDHCDIVRAAEKQFTDAHRNAVLVTSTDGYKYSDSWHYDSAGFVDLGRRFAEGVDKAAKKAAGPGVKKGAQDETAGAGETKEWVLH